MNYKKFEISLQVITLDLFGILYYIVVLKIWGFKGLLLFGAESFVFQFAIQKVKDQDI